MRKLIFTAIAASTAFAALSPAMAAQGCGPGGIVVPTAIAVRTAQPSLTPVHS